MTETVRGQMIYLSAIPTIYPRQYGVIRVPNLQALMERTWRKPRFRPRGPRRMKELQRAFLRALAVARAELDKEGK